MNRRHLADVQKMSKAVEDMRAHYVARARREDNEPGDTALAHWLDAAARALRGAEATLGQRAREEDREKESTQRRPLSPRDWRP